MTRPSSSCRSWLVASALGALALCVPAHGVAGTILFLVNNSASLTWQETAKQTLMQGWGYTVVPMSATSSQAAFDAACLTSSMVYISETITSTDLNTKIVTKTIPIVNEEQQLADEFGFSTSASQYNDTRIKITNNTHYITSPYTLGTWTITTSSQPFDYLSGTLGGYTQLATEVSPTNPTFAVFNRGDTMAPSGTVAGKRVYLPFGASGFDPNSLNSDGLNIMKRSIEWALLPISRWKLDDGSGSTATDYYGSHPGTLGGCTWTTGKSAGGLKLNGSSDYVTITNHADFQVTNALSITGWVKANSWPSGSTVSTILRKGDANPNNWQLSVANGKIEFGLDSSDGDGSGTDGNTALATGTWIFLAGTWDGTNARVYVNAVLDHAAVAHAAPIGTDTRDVYLGGRIGSTDVTDGTVDEVRFYNRCLTPGEITDLYKISPTFSTWKNMTP